MHVLESFNKRKMRLKSRRDVKKRRRLYRDSVRRKRKSYRFKKDVNRERRLD